MKCVTGCSCGCCDIVHALATEYIRVYCIARWMMYSVAKACTMSQQPQLQHSLASFVLLWTYCKQWLIRLHKHCTVAHKGSESLKALQRFACGWLTAYKCFADANKMGICMAHIHGHKLLGHVSRSYTVPKCKESRMACQKHYKKPCWVLQVHVRVCICFTHGH